MNVIDDPHWMIRPVCPLCNHIVEQLFKVKFQGKEVHKPICQDCKKKLQKSVALRR